MRIDLRRCPEELRPGLQEILTEDPRRFRRGKQVRFAPGRQGPAAKTQGDQIVISYARKTDALRALGRLLGDEEREFSETARFDLLGVMVDCSRNGVLRPDAAKTLMRRCALMGLNTFILYTEDTYELPGEPFFGYQRGRYTQEELRDLDAYAEALGMEMFLSIQTLGHLGQVLQWPAYAHLRDVDEVLLVDDKKTYELIEKMVAAASAPFRSRRLIVGMDEAHGLGTGRYLRLHGYQRAFNIFTRHLARVREICARHNVRPMIWSDMYFRLGSKTNYYYDRNSSIPRDIAARIPKDVQLAYWDYYHHDPGFYAEWIKRHRALGFEPLVAGGVWTWSHFWAALPFSFSVTDACLKACKAQNIREVIVTLWGDDGAECDLFSALPGIQFFAEHAYADAVNPRLLRKNFHGSCDADFDAWVKASEIDSVPCLARPERSCTNVGKWLLWQDPLLGLMDPQLDGISLRHHYRKLSATLPVAFPAQLARVLSLKCDLRRDLVRAYRARDKRRLRALAAGDLKSLRVELDKLWRIHRDVWMRQYKPFGWEVIEERYGALRARLQALGDRLGAYLAGDVNSIPEFEVKLEKIFNTPASDLPRATYSRVATASAAKW
jgi:hexosaminidase